jgi:hypothetical protein
MRGSRHPATYTPKTGISLYFIPQDVYFADKRGTETMFVVNSYLSSPRGFRERVGMTEVGW